MVSKRNSGQSLIEACIVIAILCICLFCGIQISQIYLTREILDYGAISGARARTVGFNDFMVEKTIKAATIPIAGEIINSPINPNPYTIIQHPHSIHFAWEAALHLSPSQGGDLDDLYQQRIAWEKQTIPLYLGSFQNEVLLDYARWNLLSYQILDRECICVKEW